LAIWLVPRYSVTLVNQAGGDVFGYIVRNTRLGKSSFNKVEGLIAALIASNLGIMI